MKRKAGHLILLSLLLICLLREANAQQNKFNGGLFFNINGIEFKGKDETHYWNSNRPGKEIGGTLGVSAGLFVKRDLTGKIYFSFEMRYIRKGSIYGFTSRYGQQAFESILIQYIEVPFLVGYRFKPSKRPYYFESGFAYAKMIGSNIETNDLTNRIGTPDAKAFKKFDVSWIGSLKFPLIMKWKENILFGLRISHSVLPIHKYYKIYNFDYGIEFCYVFS